MTVASLVDAAFISSDNIKSWCTPYFASELILVNSFSVGGLKCESIFTNQFVNCSICTKIESNKVVRQYYA